MKRPQKLEPSFEPVRAAAQARLPEGWGAVAVREAPDGRVILTVTRNDPKIITFIACAWVPKFDPLAILDLSGNRDRVVARGPIPMLIPDGVAWVLFDVVEAVNKWFGDAGFSVEADRSKIQNRHV